VRREKRVAIFRESLVMLLILLVGSWLLFKDDLFTLAVTFFVGFPGAIALMACKHLMGGREQEMKSLIDETSTKDCTKKLMLFLVAYNLVAVAVFLVLGRFNLALEGVVVFIAIELLILALVLVPEYLAARTWPTPSLLLLCSFWDTDSATNE